MYVHDLSSPTFTDSQPSSLSQLIGSTLALEYMRAEYVAPLGSSSLVFNFLFARFLVGTPVTKTDIYVSHSFVFNDTYIHHI